MPKGFSNCAATEAHLDIRSLPTCHDYDHVQMWGSPLQRFWQH